MDGFANTGVGLVVAVTSLVLGFQGWEVTRLWFYLVSSGLLILVGTQLIVYWLLLQILKELSTQEIEAKKRSKWSIIQTALFNEG